jgi:hypothetical protein
VVHDGRHGQRISAARWSIERVFRVGKIEKIDAYKARYLQMSMQFDGCCGERIGFIDVERASADFCGLSGRTGSNSLCVCTSQVTSHFALLVYDRQIPTVWRVIAQAEDERGGGRERERET